MKRNPQKSVQRGSLPGWGGFRGRCAGFTIVELLVSVAVMVLLLMIVSQMVNSASNLTKLGTQQLDMASEARLVFERMERDFTGMIRRPDLDNSIYPYCDTRPEFKASPTGSLSGNDFLYFFSQAAAIQTTGSGQTGSVGASRATTVADAIGIVGYRVWEHTNSTSGTPFFALERLCESNALNIGADRPMLFLCSSTGAGVTNYLADPKWVNQQSTLMQGTLFRLTHADSDDSQGSFHVIGNQVFRLEFALRMSPSYIDKNGGAANYPTAPYWKSAGNTVTPLSQQIQDIRDVSDIIVTIALLDTTSRKKIPGYDPVAPRDPYLTDMAQLALAFADGDTPAVASSWADTLAKIGAGTESPARNISAITRRVAAQNTRIFQHSFSLK